MRRHRNDFAGALLLVALVAGACSGDAATSAGGASSGESVTVIPDRDAPFVVANVDLTDTGFEPPTIFLPAGHPVRLVLRNRTQHEHHYRVIGMVASDVRWLEYPSVDSYLIESGDLTTEELVELAPELADLDSMADAEHVLHHLQPTYVPTKGASLAGIEPIPGEVHGYAQRGEFDTVTFFPLKTGRFMVEDVLSPEITGSVVVFLAE